ncbi:MAG: hypothetical protein ACLP1X_04895 [Polyangiaceae bacterium]
MATPTPADHPDPRNLPSWYRDRARKLRLHADRAADPEHRLQNMQRAEWYEARATIIESGDWMPRSLRTPLEDVRSVDMARMGIAETMVDVLDLELDPQLADQFAIAIGAEPGRAGELLAGWMRATQSLLLALGGVVDASGAWTFEAFDARE